MKKQFSPLLFPHHFSKKGWVIFFAFFGTFSLTPTMLVHYLGNVFVGSFAGYMQNQASVEIQVLYGVTFTFGGIPVSLMIAWVKFYTGKWRGKRLLSDRAA